MSQKSKSVGKKKQKFKRDGRRISPPPSPLRNRRIDVFNFGKAGGGLTSHFLDHMSNEDILSLRFKELGLNIDESPLLIYLAQLYRELKGVGFEYFRPHFYFSDEWFCTDKTMQIAIPFYLAHPRLALIEDIQSNGRGAEGGQSPEAFMSYVRHEVGHAFDNAYKLSTTREWAKVFGLKSLPYELETYEANPNSRAHVTTLESNYAQTHPCEDYAETFAVWLDPNVDWRREYKDRPQVLRKLRYIDRMVKKYRALPTKVFMGKKSGQIKRSAVTLRAYYEKRSKSIKATVK